MAYIYKRGRLYWIGYKRKGRWIQESTNSEYKDVARAKLRAKELRADQEDPDPVSLADFAQEYLEHKRRLGHRAVDRDEDSLGHLLPYFKGKALHEVTREAVERYVDLRLGEGAAPRRGRAWNRPAGDHLPQGSFKQGAPVGTRG